MTSYRESSKVAWRGALLALLSALLSASSVFAQASPAQVRASEGDGSTIFGNNCENCHGKLDTAPPPAMLKQMTPERIYQALTTGDMKGQAEMSKLTDKQLRDIAEWRSEEHTSELQSHSF